VKYAEFLETKRLVVPAAGIDATDADLHRALFDFQRDLTRWALRKGRAALFCHPGLGKTLMQLAWAEQIGRRTLILAPLAVAQQTVREGAKFGIPVIYARRQSQAAPHGITVTNYEMLQHFDPVLFDAVVLDESSILRSFDGKTRTALIKAFKDTPYRLCCTATPAPNDISEIANHAQFLGVMSRVEMLASFFVHDDDGWRLKGHAAEPFYRWLASWGMSLTLPSDLGYPDEGFELPPLNIRPELVRVDVTPPGQLFFTSLHGIQDRIAVRRATLDARVEAALEIVRREPDEKWLIWCGLNDEQDAIAEALGSSCVSIQGSDSPDQKVQREADWREGSTPILVSKPLAFGFGMNWQHCARMVFVGLGDSYEQYFQAIRRCHRFGQEREVRVWVVLSEAESEVYQNVLRKERDATRLTRYLVRHVASFEQEELAAQSGRAAYAPKQPMRLPAWMEAA
jgi:SNF2-related domain/Helicase conserved C-terminal domain